MGLRVYERREGWELVNAHAASPGFCSSSRHKLRANIRHRFSKHLSQEVQTAEAGGIQSNFLHACHCQVSKQQAQNGHPGWNLLSAETAQLPRCASLSGSIQLARRHPAGSERGALSPGGARLHQPKPWGSKSRGSIHKHSPEHLQQG